MKTFVKGLAVFVLAAVIFAGVLALANPTFGDAIFGIFRRNETVVTDPTQGEETTQPEGTLPEGTQPETTDPTQGEGNQEDKVEVPFTFTQFLELATTDGMWHVAPENATIYDITADEFVPETEAEKANYVAVMLRVNPYGAMSIMQEGFENVENHTGKVVAPCIELCSCKKGFHNASWNTDMGQFHWSVAEGNLALGAKSWTRMKGEVQEVLLNQEEREIIRAVACYWFVENEQGEQEMVYGIRVCGAQKDPEAPKPPVTDPTDPKPGDGEGGGEEEKETFEVTFKFVAENGEQLPAGVTSQLPASKQVTEGETYKVNFVFKAVETEDGTWVFKSWDKTSVVVNADVTFTGTWSFTAKEEPTEPTPEPVYYKVTYSNQMVDGSVAPEFLNQYLPAAEAAVEGSKIAPKELSATMHEVDEATRYVFVRWNATELTVTGDVQFVALWEKRELELPKEQFTVTYVFAPSNLPKAVTDLLPAAKTVEEGTVVGSPSIQKVVYVPGGRWVNNGWDKSQVTVNADTTVTMQWSFIINQPEPIRTHTVNYHFVMNDGSAVPMAVMAYLPESSQANNGQVVYAQNLSVDYVEIDPATRYVFRGWDKSQVTVNGSDVTFVGTWEREELELPPVVVDYNVTYVAVSTTAGKSIPAAVEAAMPTMDIVREGEIWAVPSPIKTVVEAEDGKWMFSGWDKTQFEVTGDTTVIGYWYFVENEVEEPTEPAPVYYNVNYSNTMADGSAAPAFLNQYLPAAETVLEGSVVAPKAPRATVHVVDVATRYVFVGWNANEITVDGDVTFVAMWELRALELADPEEPQDDLGLADPVVDEDDEEEIGLADPVVEDDEEEIGLADPVVDEDGEEEIGLADPVIEDDEEEDEGEGEDISLADPVPEEDVDDDARDVDDEDISLMDPPVEEEVEEVVAEEESSEQPVDDSVECDDDTNDWLDSLLP